MRFFLKASVAVVLLLSLCLANAEEEATLTPIPQIAPPKLPENEAAPITLDEAIKKVMQDAQNKVLAAKTELVDGKKIHVIKVLTLAGHIQHIKIDAATGKILDNFKKENAYLNR